MKDNNAKRSDNYDLERESKTLKVLKYTFILFCAYCYLFGAYKILFNYGWL